MQLEPVLQEPPRTVVSRSHSLRQAALEPEMSEASWTKRTRLLLSGPKSSFQINANFQSLKVQ